MLKGCGRRLFLLWVGAAGEVGIPVSFLFRTWENEE
jgi:hypothetical protein